MSDHEAILLVFTCSIPAGLAGMVAANMSFSGFLSGSAGFLIGIAVLGTVGRWWL